MNKIFYTFILFVIIFFNGCSQKVEVPTYVHTKTPLLENYKKEIKYSFGDLINKKEEVCILKWDKCIPKKDFIELVEYMQESKSVIEKHNNQITEYNKWSEKQNLR